VRHFIVMTVFAVMAAVVFGTVAKDSTQERLTYGLKVFVEFMAIGLLLSWVLYFLPF
jgi:hypothetical protein